MQKLPQLSFLLLLGALLCSFNVVVGLVRDCYPDRTPGKTNDDCYGSLWDLAVAMEEKNPFGPETFVLCPYKEYNIGERDPNEPDCFRGGDAMLQLRQFSTVQCGADGSSRNNCTITGGLSQMATTAGSYDLEAKTRIKVEGITFAKGRGGALFLAAAGDIVFKDCVFKNHMNDGTIKVVFQSFTDSGDLRTLTPVNSDAVSVVFDQCMFQTNRYPGGSPTGLRQLGLINMRSSAGYLNITNSIFLDNEFRTDFNFDTYLINVEPGNVLNMENNCFVSNSVEGRGFVHIDDLDSIGRIKGNAGISQEDSSATECGFIHVNDGRKVTCIDFDLAECAADRSAFVGTLGPEPTRLTSSSRAAAHMLLTVMIATVLATFYWTFDASV